MTYSLTFTALSEAQPGPKWKSRWDRSWPAYEVWFRSRGGDAGPTRAECEGKLEEHMPELVQVHQRLTQLAGGGDRAARFLSGWCPPAYLGGCSLAARAAGGETRLVRNYDLSPDLNEGLLLRSEWTGQAVLGMVEFLWGLSDGINDSGLCVGLSYGGSGTVRRGFGITHIVRYLLETCGTVPAALARLRILPSHMAYNLVLADREGMVASVELSPGGGLRLMDQAIATNHQHKADSSHPAVANRTMERRRHLKALLDADIAPADLRAMFLAEPLFQREYDRGFGTLFTADYAPVNRSVTLAWKHDHWEQKIDSFEEGVRTISYSTSPEWSHWHPHTPDIGRNDSETDWVAFGLRLARLFAVPADGWPTDDIRGLCPNSGEQYQSHS